MLNKLKVFWVLFLHIFMILFTLMTEYALLCILANGGLALREPNHFILYTELAVFAVIPIVGAVALVLFIKSRGYGLALPAPPPPEAP